MKGLCAHINFLEFTQRWIVNDNWTYTADLSPLINASHANEKTLLVFYGLDTVANIVCRYMKYRAA
jgi:hypothetical protein